MMLKYLSVICRMRPSRSKLWVTTASVSQLKLKYLSASQRLYAHIFERLVWNGAQNWDKAVILIMLSVLQLA